MLTKLHESCAVVATALLVTATGAAAGTLNRPIGDPAKNNGLRILFVDTPITASITLSGTRIRTDEAFSETFATPTGNPQNPSGGFWVATMQLDLDEDVDDEINLALTLQHLHRPHFDIDAGPGLPYQGGFVVEAEQFPGSNREVTLQKMPAPKPRKHGGHRDRFFDESINFVVDNVGLFGQIQDIQRWRYTLSAEHEQLPVPEPFSGVLLGVGGAIAMVLRQSRRGSHILG